MLRYVTVKPVSRWSSRRDSIELLYLSEVPVKPGDIVEANVYESPEYHRVLHVGSTRKAAKSTYTGAVKSIRRVVTDKERRAIERLERAENAVAKAAEALDTIIKERRRMGR